MPGFVKGLRSLGKSKQTSADSLSVQPCGTALPSHKQVAVSTTVAVDATPAAELNAASVLAYTEKVSQ